MMGGTGGCDGDGVVVIFSSDRCDSGGRGSAGDRGDYCYEYCNDECGSGDQGMRWRGYAKLTT